MASPDVQEYYSWLPLSMTTAEPGWRAVIATDTDPSGGIVRPVVGWGVFRFVKVTDTGAVILDLGNVIEGVVTRRRGVGVELECAQNIGETQYFGPDMGTLTNVDDVLRDLRNAPRTPRTPRAAPRLS
jgi:hypothetical protein